MRTEPQVFLVGRSGGDINELESYLRLVGGSSWAERKEDELAEKIKQSYKERGLPGQFTEAGLQKGIDHWKSSPVNLDSEDVVEVGGRLCYRSWEPELNPNVKKVRENRKEYLENILKSGHGSVLEHVSFSFIFHNVSRVFTHELVRHRVGVAISQESLRFVRLTEIPFWFPPDVPEIHDLLEELVDFSEKIQQRAQERFDWDSLPFSKKKSITSALRRAAPIGLGTGLLWTANVRTIRHVISMRTALGAEIEMRTVFNKVAELMEEVCPDLFQDMYYEEVEEGSPPVVCFVYGRV